jgi:hypothetical protein
MPELPVHYTILKGVERILKRSQRRRRVVIVSLVGLVICCALFMIWNGGSSIDKRRATQPVSPVEQSTADTVTSLPSLPKRIFKVPAGNLVVKQNRAVSIVDQIEAGVYGLPITANHAQDIDGLVIDAEESSLSIRPYLDRRHGKLKLRLMNQGTKSIVALSALVEWMSIDHQVLSAKQMKIIPSEIGLYVGETRAAYLSNFDLSPNVIYARVTVTNLVFGSQNAKRAQPSPACIGEATDLGASSSFTVNAYAVLRNSFVTRALFSFKNESADLTTLYAYPSFYNAQGQLLKTASKRTILSRIMISSDLMPIFKHGETRFFQSSSILSREDRQAVSKVCVEFTSDSSLP